MIITSTLEALLRSMDAEPKNLGLRLIFADALEEAATCDGDHATVEAIRRFCQFDLTKSGLPRKPAREWLKKNWERLIPQAQAKHLGSPRVEQPKLFTTDPPTREQEAARSTDWAIRHEWKTASRLETYWRLYPESYASFVESRTYTVKIDFHRGLIESFRTFGRTARKQLNRLVIADQPWAEVSWEERECPACGLLIHTNRMHWGRDYLVSFVCERCDEVYERARKNLYVLEESLSDETRKRNVRQLSLGPGGHLGWTPPTAPDPVEDWDALIEG